MSLVVGLSRRKMLTLFPTQAQCLSNCWDPYLRLRASNLDAAPMGDSGIRSDLLRMSSAARYFIHMTC